MKILIADDDLVTLRNLQATLSQMGDEVISVDDGTKAWEVLSSKTAPSLAILDWMMPGLEGADICRKLRSDATLPAIYVLMLTSRTDRKDIVEGLDAGADDYLTKPFHPDELRARIQAGKRILSLQTSLMTQLTNLQTAFAQIKTLQGLLPICAYCKRIRNGFDYWQQIEAYIAQHTNAEFSHGVCPDCAKEHLEPQMRK